LRGASNFPLHPRTMTDFQIDCNFSIDAIEKLHCTHWRLIVKPKKRARDFPDFPKTFFCEIYALQFVA
jgi:hypothetical protein